MTVTTTANSIRYAGNGTTKAFTFPYLFFAPSDLVITLITTATNVPVSPAPVLNGAATYDYTVTGVLTDGAYASGGTVTFNTAPITGHTVLLVRSVPATQDVTLIDNTKFPAATVNTEFDKLTILAQQSAFLSGVSLQIPSSEVGLIVIAAPVASRANKLLLWDATGNLSTIDTANIIGGSVPSGPAAGDLAGTYPSPTIKASVGLTGSPTAPTATPGTNTTQIASTAFVAAAANGFRRLGTVTTTAAQATVDFTSLAADINHLEFSFDVTPTANVQDFNLRFYNASGTLVTTATHNYVTTQANTAMATNAPPGVVAFSGGGAIALNTTLNTRRISNNSTQGGIRGYGKVANTKAVRIKSVNWQSDYLADDGSAWLACTGAGSFNTAMAITGLQFLFGATTFAVGGNITLWGSP